MMMDSVFDITQSAAIDDSLRRYLLSTITSTVPLDITTSHIKSAGHGVFAQGDISAGQEVFRVINSFVHGSSDPDNTCDYCFSHIDTKFNSLGHYTNQSLLLMDCKRCKVVKYCSKECQVLAWSKHHKAECKDLMNASRYGIRDTHSGPQTQAIKTAFLRLVKKHTRKELSESQHKALENLESHREDYNKESFRNEFPVSPHSIGASSPKSDDWGFDMYCKLMTNCISIRQPNNEQSLGVALDPFCSMINHSCDPNVYFFFEGIQLRCRTRRPITAGEELFISYTDQSYDADSRGKELLQGYSFRCTCSRCQTELEHGGDADVHAIETKLKMQEQLLQSHREIAMRAMEPASIERHIHSITTVSDPQLRRNLGLEDGWPEHLQPMPDTRFYLARLTQSVDTEYSLKTLLKLCFVTYPNMYGGPTGKEWVMAFSLLVFTLRFYIKKQNVRGDDWSLVYIVYLETMTSNAAVCYGADTAFVKANQELLRKETAALSPEQASSFGLVMQYRVDQKNLLRWAGISEAVGVKIPNTGLRVHKA